VFAVPFQESTARGAEALALTVAVSAFLADDHDLPARLYRWQAAPGMGMVQSADGQTAHVD
jgi:hypothetical protein